MRLEGRAQAGFYPTPESVLALIATHLGRTYNSSLLDPCAGEGVAAAKIGRQIEAHTVGIELEAGRAALSKNRLKQVFQGDAFDHKAEGFSLLFLNPPYDYTDGGERLEVKFLRHYLSSLVVGGVLVYIIPEHYLEAAKGVLTTWFDKLSIYRFPEEEYKAYQQVVIFGVKSGGALSAGLPAVEPLEGGEFEYRIPQGRGAEVYMAGMDEAQMVAEAMQGKAWNLLWDAVKVESLEGARPLLPWREGHLAMLVAGGLVNGTVIAHRGQRYLLRGMVKKNTRTVSEGNQTRESEYLSSSITMLDLDTGHLIRVEEQTKELAPI